MGVESALSALEPGIATKFGKKSIFRANNNVGILFIFHNPEIPGLNHHQSRDSGLGEWAGIPELESLERTFNQFLLQTIQSHAYNSV